MPIPLRALRCALPAHLGLANSDESQSFPHDRKFFYLGCELPIAGLQHGNNPLPVDLPGITR